MWKLGLSPDIPFLGIFASNFRHFFFEVWLATAFKQAPPILPYKIRKFVCLFSSNLSKFFVFFWRTRVFWSLLSYVAQFVFMRDVRIRPREQTSYHAT
jgi:hypothetical protein